MPSVYHPETDGASKQTNKTINQMLYVDRNQKDWVYVLPCVCFAIMSTVNKSTGFTPFFLRFGHNPRVLPPLVADGFVYDSDATAALKALEQLETDVMESKDNLLKSKIAQ